MAAPVLVTDDVAAGIKLIRVLHERGFAVAAAAWIYYTESEDWRLVLGTPRAELDLTAAYLDLINWLKSMPDLERRIGSERVKLVSPDDPTLGALAKNIRINRNGRDTVRLSHDTVNGIYIDDAVVYRLAA